MTRMLVPLLPLAALALASCATLSEDQCQSGAWREIGMRDGAEGRTSGHVARHREACAAYGIAPDIAAWEAGRRSGLPLYCRPARAWEEGADGRRLSPVCPAENRERLSEANRRGLIYHRIGRDIAEAEREIRRITAEVRAAPSDDPARSSRFGEIAALRLEIAMLRAERARYRL